MRLVRQKDVAPRNVHMPDLQTSETTQEVGQSNDATRPPTIMGRGRGTSRSFSVLLGLGALKISAKVLRAVGRILAFKVTPLLAEFVVLGPAGPLIVEVAKDTLSAFRSVPTCLVETYSQPSPLSGVSYLLRAASNSWAKIKFHKKCCLVLVASTWLNGKRRDEKRARRAASVQAFRRLNATGLRKLVHACEHPLLNILLPDMILKDQDWVCHDETWWCNYNQEKVEWFNRIVQEMWPHLDTIVGNGFSMFVNPLLNSLAAKHMVGVNKMQIETFSLGTVAPTFESIAINIDPDGEFILVDTSFSWQGDVDLDLCLRGPAIFAGRGPISVELREITVSGKIRIKISPLLSVLPIIGGITLMMTEPPVLNYKVNAKPIPGTKLNLDSIPGLKSTIISAIQMLITDAILFPNAISIPIACDEPGKPEGSFADSLKVRPIGVLIVDVIEAKNLPAADMSGTSDPYALLGLALSKESLSKSAVKKTGTQFKTLNPKWNEHVVLDVYSLELQTLVLKVNDQDKFMSDDMLGELVLRLCHLEKDKPIEAWYKLQTPPQEKLWDVVMRATRGSQESGAGEIHLRMTFRALSEENRATTPDGRRASTVRGAYTGPAMRIGAASILTKMVHDVCENFQREDVDVPKIRFRRRLAELLHIPVRKGGLHKYLYKDTGNLEGLSEKDVKDLASSSPAMHGIHSGYPTWAAHPNVESLMWLDAILVQLWPCAKAVVTALQSTLGKVLMPTMRARGVIPPWLSASGEFDLGELPPLIESIRVFPGLDNDLVLEASVKVAGDQSFSSSLRWFNNPLSQVEMHVTQMQFFGVIRLRLRPLVPILPIVAGVSVSFLGEPFVDASLSLKFPLLPGIDLANIPGFELLKDSFTRTFVRPMIQHPAAIHLPILDMASPVIRQHVGKTRQVARMLRVRLISASNLPAADWLMGANLARQMGRQGSSDPFAVVVRSGVQPYPQRSRRSGYVTKTLNPVWDMELANFDVDTSAVDLTFGVFDSDVMSQSYHVYAAEYNKNLTSSSAKEKEARELLLDKQLEPLVVYSKSRAIPRTFAGASGLQLPISAFVSYLVKSTNTDSLYNAVKDAFKEELAYETAVGKNRVQMDECYKEAVLLSRTLMVESRGAREENQVRKLTRQGANNDIAKRKRTAEGKTKIDDMAAVRQQVMDEYIKQNMKCDVNLMIEEEVQMNGNDFLGMAILRARDLPKDMDARVIELPLSTQVNANRSPKATGEPTLKVEVQWSLLQTQHAGMRGSNSAQRPSESQFTDGNVKGSLTVTVGSLAHLKINRAQTTGKSMRPAVIVTVGEQTQKTMAGKGRHPRIDETLMFHQVSPELMMEIQVIDSRSIWLRSSNVLGSLSLPLHEIIKHGHTSRTYELRHGKSATISLNFVWRQLIDAKMLAPEVLRKINTRSFSVNGLDDILRKNETILESSA
ncbi:hypothetical protein CYMTET_3636 [Cymbomonas tetramitiformis]|uniref:Uncharacterized protein n=1 Tax=Cymbomonas tetramitiformis TaxID=36881 RepID=A0AAE0LKV3_9CHLO|nr:hypothetical protein CYMTET_3636 [Cymbomonas tetramitiformis]